MITEPKISQLPEFIKSAIDKEIKRVTDEELQKASEKIKERSAQIVSGVVLHLEKEMSMQTMENKLIITVRLRE